MGGKRWFGCSLSLSVQDEGEQEMTQTISGHSWVYSPLHQASFISVVEVVGRGWSSCRVDDVGTFTRIDLVQRVWETSVQGQDMYGRSPRGGRQGATTSESSEPEGAVEHQAECFQKLQI